MFELKWYVYESDVHMSRLFDSYADMARFVYTLIWTRFTVEYTMYENGVAIHSGNTFTRGF